MVRPVESIRKDLNALEGATATLAEEFSQIYATYLTVLGHTMRRQMIMATYHLCTQVYPEEFLTLAVSDRTRLQEGIQTLGRKAQSWLQQLMEPEQLSTDSEQGLDPSDLNRLEAALAALARSGADEDEDEAEPDLSDLADLPEAEAIAPAVSEEEAPETAPEMAEESESAEDTALALDPQKLMQSVIMAAISSEVQEAFSDRPFTGDRITPTLVAKHHLLLEQMIRQVLQRVSKKANQLLRKAQVIPDLPGAVVEAAADVDGVMSKGRSVPNVLNVLVAIAGDGAADFDPPDDDDDEEIQEIQALEDDDEEAIEGTMTHLAAVQLRLSDLEFGDVQTALWRSKLRTSVGRLRKLGKQYQRAERELAIAQAEQAWRAVWHDSSSR